MSSPVYRGLPPTAAPEPEYYRQRLLRQRRVFSPSADPLNYTVNPGRHHGPCGVG